jgi:DNA-binding Lrp family transcriptional regulator
MEILDCFEVAGETELIYVLTTEELDSLEIILADEINGEALFEKYLESEKDYQDELRFVPSLKRKFPAPAKS